MGKKIKFWFLMMIGLMVVFGTQLIGCNVYAAEGDEDACASVQYSRDGDNYSKVTICQRADGSLYNPYQNDYASQHIPYFEIENGNVRKICFVLPNGRGPGGNSRGCKDFPEGIILKNNEVLLAAIDSTDGCRYNGVKFTCTSQNNSGNVAWYIKHVGEQVKKPIEINSEESTGDERGTCASVYYKNSRNEDQGRSIATVCQRSDGSMYVWSPNNTGPHFVVTNDEEKNKTKISFVIPGYKNYSEDVASFLTVAFGKELTDNSDLIEVVKRNDSCSWNEEEAECKFTDKLGDGFWYVSLTEEAAKKPGEALVEPDNEELDCLSSGAGESLGWILCPILDLVSGAAEYVYDEFVEPALMLEPQLFSGQDDNYGTRYAWGVFQGIANILFIILLLIVIVSQLTGYGIDNYGIKKILPKLIISAILINLSYIICLVCVDVSNIVGNGLQSFFNSLPVFQDGDSDIVLAIGTGHVSVASVYKAKFVAMGILGVLVTQIWPLFLVGGWVGVLVALLGITIVVFVSIFFTFLLLAAREAAVVILTVISPLAFACFVLPNTKYLFDRWWKAGKALLFLYPICGILMGGGNYVSKLLLTTSAAGGFFTALMAMLIGVMPLFFIPSFLQKSLAAFDNIGTKMAGFGQRWGGKIRNGAESSIKETERYKSYHSNFARNRQEQNANRTIERLNERKRRQGGVLNANDMLQQARAQETLEKMKRENYAAEAIMVGEEAKNWDLEKMKEEWGKAYHAGDERRLRALTTVAQKKFGNGAANMIGKVMANQGGTDENGKPIADNRLVVNEKQNDAIARSLRTLNDIKTYDSGFSNIMSAKATDAFDMISTMGMVDGKVQNMDYFSSGSYDGKDATKNTDFMSQTAATLKRMANAKDQKGNYGISDAMLLDLKYGTSEAHKAFRTDAKKMEIIDEAIKARGLTPPSDVAGAQTAAAQTAGAQAAAAQTAGAQTATQTIAQASGAKAPRSAGGRDTFRYQTIQQIKDRNAEVDRMEEMFESQRERPPKTGN